MKIFGMDHRALFLGILVGSAAKLLTHAVGLIKHLHYLRPSLDWRNPAFRTMLVLMLPLLAGIIFAKIRDNFNNIYILTHIDQQGILMANDLGRKLFATIQWLVPYALQIALFPFLCELVSQQDRKKLGMVLGSSCKLLLAVFVPARPALNWRPGLGFPPPVTVWYCPPPPLSASSCRAFSPTSGRYPSPSSASCPPSSASSSATSTLSSLASPRRTR
jgi:hypothetical protein